MKLKSIGKLKWIITILTMSFLNLEAKASTIIAQDFEVHPWGYTAIWENHPGSYAGSKVLFVKFVRTVKTIDAHRVEVTLSYPDVPEALLKSHAVVQYNLAFQCGLNNEALPSSAKVVELKEYKSSFAHPNQQQSNDPAEMSDGHQDAKVCKLTINFGKEVTLEDMQSINWNLATTVGFESLNVVERQYVRKNFSGVAAPYLSFFENNEVSFRTDDEFWFLAAASIHREPTLAQSFKNSNRGFVSRWVQKLAIYLVTRLENDNYTEVLERYIGKLPKNIETTYEIEVDSEERKYEI